MVEIDFEALTTQELADLIESARVEREKREYLANAPAIIKELNQNVLNAKGVKFGEAWKQPQGAHDAYPEGWEVTDNGKTWISTVNANVWRPGVSGWREKALPGGSYPVFVQPTGAHDAYRKGDKVTFDGKKYESLIDGNVWSPAGYPAGWKEIAV